ncbi:MAG: hypothetical protein M1813_001544 [Trichoglossum hirsutum]|nr:MAG: hypothetical protein M1813_001544 [Trichoglossum hirsutum]
MTDNPTFIPTATSPVSAPSSTGRSNGKDGGNGGGPPDAGNNGSNSVAVAVFSWPVAKTFLGGYLPIVAARVLQMSWISIHTNINELEPFSQLASGDGAPASVLFSPGFLTWYSWLAYGAVWVMSPLASESIFFDTNYGCANPNPNASTNPCWPPRMSVNTPVIRILQVLLSIVAILIVLTAVLWFRKPSGCSGEPTSIAAIASIMGHPEVEQDFRNLNAEISTKELKEYLKEKKYKLGMYHTTTGAERYGIIPASADGSVTQGVGLAPREIDPDSPAAGVRFRFNFVSGWKNLAMYTDGIFFCFLLGILSATIAHFRDINNSKITKFFRGGSAGRRLLFAVLGCLAASGWTRLERESQTLSPYMRLNQPNARPRPTILLRKRTLPLTSLFPMLRNQHFTAATIAFTALLSEFLVVALSGLPYRPGQLRGEFLFCTIASLVVLSVMLFVLSGLNIWRRFLPHLPRKPDSVAAVMTYVCDSKMNADFEGLEQVSISQRDKSIMQLGKIYRYGLRRRTGGGVGWVVDEAGETRRSLEANEGMTSDESIPPKDMGRAI